MAEFSPSSDEPQPPLMTSSYHEIAETEKEKSVGNDSMSDLDLSLPGARKLFEKARHWVGDLSLEGIVSQEGQQVTYVAEDIAEKIRLASPVKSTQGHNLPSSEAGVSKSDDLNVIINEVEVEAKKLASSVDSLTENLTGILHSISSMTVDCTFVASDGVTQLCDTADASIKVMYQVMAKSEELNKAVQPVYRLHQQIKETKRLLDRVEAEMG